MLAAFVRRFAGGRKVGWMRGATETGCHPGACGDPVNAGAEVLSLKPAFTGSPGQTRNCAPGRAMTAVGVAQRKSPRDDLAGAFQINDRRWLKLLRCLQHRLGLDL